MSDPLRIALATEGPTDLIVLEATLRAILPGRPFVLTQLQPEGSLAFGPLGTGWTGVYRWCKQAAKRGGGHLGGDGILFQNHDILILHIDADVACETYANGSIRPESGDGVLPCAQSCPPPSATTDKLRSVLLTWCGESSVPAKTVICMPSKSTEAWVIAAIFPNDQVMSGGIECYPSPETRLAQQPKRQRIQKCQKDYRRKAPDIERAWSRLANKNALLEAERFQSELLAVVHAI
jgi:hypothetical protein